VRRIVEEQGLDPRRIAATRPGGRILKETHSGPRQSHRPSRRPRHLVRRQRPHPPRRCGLPPPAASVARPSRRPADESGDRLVPMSRIRSASPSGWCRHSTRGDPHHLQRVDMTRVMDLRARLKESFEKKHGVKLGFMSFFTRALVSSPCWTCRP
jgi:2-oxoglutarate dehydrogenase E2 component (dihydrolipoamide succinyltransferase)